ncbi:ABC transporter substrate-binding protein [Arthrobacter sp. 35W]|uniref:ABC transporter substrate-binding protein n=1 Tax=Arthrobacter sp. 35W TaxID=1132441 RepID=UPI0004120F60|nr:ABC transporter substrate-binding protein [Arthrobacter sp. 35W]
MTFPRILRLVLAATVVLTTGLAATGCTNASQGLAGTGPASVPGSPSFDPSTLHKDDALAAMLPDSLKGKDTITVGSDTTYAPAEFLGGTDGQTPMGFDVDFAKAIGATLGLTVDFRTAGFATILPGLGTKYDLGMSAFSITKERMKAVNFVDYFKAGSIWAVQKGNPQNVSVDNLCGLKVGVQTGSVQEDPDLTGRSKACTDAGKPAIDVVSLPNQTDITTRLVNGGIAAMVSGGTTITYALTQTGGQLELLGGLYNPDHNGIAVAKSDPELADLVAKVMNKLIADGSYAKIMDRWGIAVLSTDKSVVNPEVDR